MHHLESTGRRARRITWAAVLAAGLACLAAPAAHADSIVYIDGGNVWTAKPDGSGKVQLTDGGSWHSPTQADDGTIAAVEGTGPIQVMASDGRPLHAITTPEARTGNGGLFAPRPVDLSFTPDGSRLAYSYVQGSCPPASSCNVQRSTFYTEANVSTATPVDVFGNQFGVSDPEWVTDNRALVFGGAGSQVSIDELGGGDYSFTPWMTPNADMGDGEVTRDGTRLAATFDYGDNTLIAFFAVKGDVKTELPPAAPDPACNTASGDARHADPTWSPDGAGVAYASSAGIEVGYFSEFGPDRCVVGNDSILTPTGTQPDWGPANPPAARWTPPASSGGHGHGDAPGGTPAGGGQTPAATPPAVTIKSGGKATRGALRKGLRVKVAVTGAGRVSVKLTSGARKVAAGSARATGAGTVAVALSKVGRAKAARLSGRKLELAVTVTPAGGAPVTAIKSVRIR